MHGIPAPDSDGLWGLTNGLDLRGGSQLRILSSRPLSPPHSCAGEATIWGVADRPTRLQDPLRFPRGFRQQQAVARYPAEEGQVLRLLQQVSRLLAPVAGIASLRLLQACWEGTAGWV